MDWIMDSIMDSVGCSRAAVKEDFECLIAQ